MSGPYIALDPSFLLVLASGADPDAELCMQAIRQNGFSAIVTPSTMIELARMVRTSPRETNLREMPRKALQGLSANGITPMKIRPNGHGIVDVASRRLQQLGLLSDYHYGSIIAETGICRAVILLTYRVVLCEINPTSLALALAAMDLPDCVATTPSIFLSAMADNQQEAAVAEGKKVTGL